ncbi:glycosyltransferase [Elizabethkingia anophelis]|jgi:hypothetical protein|uniref:glycosyltransferase n=1 Tax=Elizabethkingia anophelis TaxID=1117645 RepID=UPI003557D4F2
MNKILLSIVIPTKDRYSTLIPIVNSLIKYIKSDSVEFIIQDNSSNPKRISDLLFDNRIKYNYTPGNLSIKENTTLAIEQIRGKYSIFIGDDDLISPYVMEVVEIMEKKSIDCLIYNAAYYWWDSVEFANETYYHKKKAFWIPRERDSSLEIINAKEELNSFLSNGATGMYKLARYYHGIVKTSLLKEIKNRTGEYLNGSSPDMGFAVSLNLSLEKYFFINYPISVYGASKNSGGGWTASKKHYGKIEDQKHLPENIMEIWNKNIPKIWSEASIYAQTTHEILLTFNEKDKKINFEAFYGTMLAFEPYLFSYIAPVLRQYLLYKPLSIFNIIKFYIKRKIGINIRNFKYRTKKIGFDVEVFEDTDKVMEYMKNHLKLYMK